MTDIKYVAFDVHLSTISAAVVDLSGKLITQAVFQTEASAIRDFLRGLSGKVHLTFEEGTHSPSSLAISAYDISAFLFLNSCV